MRGTVPPRKASVIGLSLIEVLVTLLLVSLAFSLIFGIVKMQSEAGRHQEAAQRFLVDSQVFLEVLARDLGSAFAVDTGGGLITIGHLTGELSSGGRLPFNASLPYASTYSEQSPLETVPSERGPSCRTVYTRDGEVVIRQYAETIFSGDAIPSRQAVMTGLNDASVEVGPRDPSQLTVHLTMLTKTRVLVVDRVLFAPGLQQ